MSDVIKAKWQATDWRVYSYLLLPGFQYQHHRKHIRCFRQREAQTAAPSDKTQDTTKRLIYRQTLLNKQPECGDISGAYVKRQIILFSKGQCL